MVDGGRQTRVLGLTDIWPIFAVNFEEEESEVEKIFYESGADIEFCFCPSASNPSSANSKTEKARWGKKSRRLGHNT